MERYSPIERLEGVIARMEAQIARVKTDPGYCDPYGVANTIAQGM